MFEGQVVFQGNFSGLVFEPTEIQYPDKDVVGVTIASSIVQGLTLIVKIKNQNSRDFALLKAEEVAFELIKLIAFQFSSFHQVTRKEVVEFSANKTSEIVAGSSELNQQFHTRVIGSCLLSAAALKPLRALLERRDNPNYMYYDFFYFAIGLEDPLAQFMALYNIILSLKGDKQEQVDKFVITKQPNIHTNLPFYSRKSGMPETIYTKLRNQIGHSRSGTTVQSTREAMRKNLPGLIEVVREVIRTSM
ncbi:MULTISPECIES: hypothetical protein [unclassified Leptolyngbya]|uniref:hypothetical protein n=1 Tax=unclassified Leptolyngbya TaxID=2650499 RepID=UPI001684FA50|nr:MULTISPECIES: hypothetical protein [unclassified Leptolyngbya]MBD1913674.1 hypothetical protein [Leptolyngbya sp. FACHB-8]MBD2157054.1 hypothetical protein [Leptolyngbya sp. FACHB-16]